MLSAVRPLAKAGYFLIFALTLAVVLPSKAQARFSAIVIDAGSGEVLYENGADVSRYPASLTKMMTLYMVFSALEEGRIRLGETMPVSRRAAAQPPSKLGLHAGSGITVKNAILALVTKSANDVATVVAEHLSGSERAFARAMTAKARSLGMKRTTFRNASGLPNSGQMSTARDMSRLGQALLRDHPQYYHYFSTEQFKYGRAHHRNHNGLLTTYSGLDGIKTGYIRASGFNLVASAKRGDQRLIGVVFGARTPGERGRIMTSLLDNGFDGASQSQFETALLSQRKSVSSTGIRNASLTQQPRDGVIQVGVYADRAGAISAAQRAKKRLPKLLHGSRTNVVKTRIKTYGRKNVYLARLSNVRSQNAKSACRYLNKRKNSQCTVVRSGITSTRKPAAIKTASRVSASFSSIAIAAPAPRPSTVTRDNSHATRSGPYGVQVGAFSGYKPAYDTAEKAIEVASMVLNDATIRVVPLTKRNRKQVFRARVLGVDKQDAHQACKILSAKDFPCMVLRM